MPAYVRLGDQNFVSFWLRRNNAQSHAPSAEPAAPTDTDALA